MCDKELVTDKPDGISPKCDCGYKLTLKRIICGDKVRSRKSCGFWSKVMGVHPNQVEGEKQIRPDWQFNEKGEVWIENYQDQKVKAKELGMVVG